MKDTSLWDLQYSTQYIINNILSANTVYGSSNLVEALTISFYIKE